MAKLSKMTIPIFAKVGSRGFEIGKVEIDVEILPSGKVKAPSPAAFIRALKKAKVR